MWFIPAKSGQYGRVYSGYDKLSVSVDDKPHGIPLRDIGEKLYLPEVKKNVDQVRIISNETKGRGSGGVPESEKAIKAIGGTVESYYYAFGDSDYCLILDLPDNVTTAAVTLVTNASGTIKNRTTVLITPEEMDQAVVD